MRLSNVSFILAGVFAGFGLQRLLSGSVTLGCHSRPGGFGGGHFTACSGDYDCEKVHGPHYTCWFGACVPQAQANALSGPWSPPKLRHGSSGRGAPALMDFSKLGWTPPVTSNWTGRRMRYFG